MLLAGLQNITSSIAAQLAAIKSQLGQSTVEGAKSNHEVAEDSSSVVKLSETAKVLAREPQSFEEVGKQARIKLDELIQRAAEKQGIKPSEVNLAAFYKAGDFSAFSDQELAAIQLNRDGLFTEDESSTGNALLGARLAASLRPFDWNTTHDHRLGCTAFNALYAQMSPEVREAMHCTPDVMASNNNLLRGATQQFGALSASNVTGILQQLAGISNRGGLSFALTGSLFNQAGLFGNVKSVGGGWF